MTIITIPHKDNMILCFCDSYIEHENRLETIINKESTVLKEEIVDEEVVTTEETVLIPESAFWMFEGFEYLVKYDRPEILEIPEGIEPTKHSYDGVEFRDCSLYTAPPKTNEELEQEINQLKQQNADLMYQLMSGGVL